MKIAAVVQARMASTRFPGKIMKIINGMPMIYWQLKRIQESDHLNEIFVVTTDHFSDDAFCVFLKKNDFNFYRGSTEDVHSRYVDIIKSKKIDICVRLTADSPLFMKEILDKMLLLHINSGADYTTNNLPPTYPDGLDIEVINSDVLINLNYYKLLQYEKEHVTIGVYSRENVFTIQNYLNAVNLSNLRWTVDYQDDFQFISEIFNEFKGNESKFDFADVLKFLTLKPEITNSVMSSRRDESLKNISNLPKSVSRRFSK